MLSTCSRWRCVNMALWTALLCAGIRLPAASAQPPSSTGVGPWRGLQTFVYGAGDARITNNAAGVPRDFDFDGSFGPSFDDGLGGSPNGTFLNSITFDALASPNPDQIDTLGGYYRSSGSAGVFAADSLLRLTVDVDTAFEPSTAMPPLNLLGMGYARSRVVAEFLMPPDPVTVDYDFHIDHSGSFVRQELIHITNLSSGQFILEQFQAATGAIPLVANEGDWIRVILWSTGQVPNAPASTNGNYTAHGEVTLTVPEPSTVVLVATGCYCCLLRRRKSKQDHSSGSRRVLGLAACAFLMPVLSTQAGEIWTWSHVAAGGGSAHVFDGGRVEYGSSFVSGSSAGTLGMAFSASDSTHGATPLEEADYLTNGHSNVFLTDESLRVGIDFDTGYLPGDGPQGDRPGGTGEGTMWSTVSFQMPGDALRWSTIVGIFDTSFASGSTLLTVENVTQSRLLLEISQGYSRVETLSGHTGDLIRVTAEITGVSNAPGNDDIITNYGSDISVRFTIIPEPTTAALLAAGLLCGIPQWRRHMDTNKRIRCPVQTQR